MQNEKHFTCVEPVIGLERVQQLSLRHDDGKYLSSMNGDMRSQVSRGIYLLVDS